MDNHPIPQDVTGFQFKLIGSMTIKQFAYVAAACILAVIAWYLPFKMPWLLFDRFGFVPIAIIGGVIVAFVPIDGRPIDVMFMNFVHAIFEPNQFVYHKLGRKLSITTVVLVPVPAQGQIHHISRKVEKSRQLETLLRTTHSGVRSKIDEKEASFLQTFSAMPITPASSSPQPLMTIQPIPNASLPKTQDDIAIEKNKEAIHQELQTQWRKSAPLPPQPLDVKNQNLEQQSQSLEKELEEAKKEELSPSSPQNQAAAHKKVQELENQLNEVHAQKTQLEQELMSLKRQLDLAQKPQSINPSETPVPALPPAPQPDIQHTRIIPQNMAKSAGLPHVSDTPNIVIGIVKDSRGNVLSNILVEIKDKDENPVRAFKTNALGQFASATPLLNATYTIELEDPKKQHTFDRIQITTKGEIMLPIEIISHDEREDLRKALFN